MFHLSHSTPLAVVAILVVSLAAPTPVSAQQAYAYSNTFENATGLTIPPGVPSTLWAVDNTPAVANTASATPPFASGGTSLNYNNGTDFNTANQRNYGNVRTEPINLTGMTTATLTFWCRFSTEGGTFYDQRWFRIFDGAGTSQLYTAQLYTGAASPWSCPSQSSWHLHTFTLAGSYVNVPIVVEFFFDSQDGAVNGGQGWFVDDLQIIGTDNAPPATITNLTATNPTMTGAKIDWTSPSDNDVSGVAQSFDLRYATAVITAANFASATQVSGEPQPNTAGTPHTVTVTGLQPGTTYHFAIRTTDKSNNVSLISNVPSVTTTSPPPAPPSSSGVSAKPADDTEDILPCSAGSSAAPMGVLALAGLMVLAFMARRK